MGIKELLAKVNREEMKVSPDKVLTTEQVKNETSYKTEVDSILTTEQVSNKSNLGTAIDIKTLPFSKLLDYYSEIRSWLETHECQSGTENKLDVNDRPYNSELYCKNLNELEEVTCEIFSRPITDGLEEKIKKYGL